MNALTPIEPEHSDKGGSSAERWMNCPGSTVILKELKLPQTDEKDYQAEGIAAHEVGEYCLKNSLDTWEVIGQQFHGVEVTDEMADAVQVYLDYARALMRVEGVTVMIEERIGKNRETRPHPDFFGRVDLSVYGPEVLDIVDYKHGEGILVDPDDNEQMKYYAYGVIHERLQRKATIRGDRLVRLTIVQPRCYCDEGPIRTWETTAGEIIHWGENVLIPAMQAAEVDQSFDAGQWCRFCPAKLFCPQLTAVFRAAMTADPKTLPSFSAQRLANEYAQLEAVKFYKKALEEEVYRRNIIGHTVPGTKLVQKQAKRVFKDGALAVLKARLGDAAFTEPELKTPAAVESIGPDAKKLVREWAFTPNNGLTVAPEGDRRGAVKVEKTADIFAHMIPADEPNGEQHDE